MKLHKSFLFAITLIFSGNAPAADAQQDSGAQVVLQWLVKTTTSTDATKTMAAKKKPAQTQSISIDHGSTTFVDQSSGADLVSGALNLAGLGGGATGGIGSGTVTASLYSLYALASDHTDPLTPSFYNSHSSLRTVFFTAGREQEQQGTTAQTLGTPGTVLGVKWLPVNRRDASFLINNKDIDAEISGVAAKYAGDDVHFAQVVLDILTTNRDIAQSKIEFLRSLTSTDEVQKDVDALKESHAAEYAAVQSAVSSYAASSKANQAVLDDLVNALKKRLQVSVAFQTTQRGAGQNDDYQGEVIVDEGITNNLFATFNGSYDYSNSSKVGADVRSGRGAVELSWDLVKPKGVTLKKPFQLALSGEGVLKSSQWQYRAQLQLSIPVAAGVDLPVSFGYGNNTALLQQQEKSVYGKFGITFDLGKVADALKGNR